MRSPLRNQIFVPIAGLLTLAVLLFTAASAWFAAEGSRAQTRRHMDAVAQALGNASYPLTDDVVRRIGAMIQGQVVVLDSQGQIAASTIPPQSELQALLSGLQAAQSQDTTSQTVVWNQRRHLVTAIRLTQRPRAGTLLLLFPEQEFSVIWRDSLIAPLAVSIPVLLLALGLAMLISGRIGRRVDQLRDLFRRIAAGDFQPVAVSGKNDEIRDLMNSANSLSQQLRTLQQNLIAAERLQLLGQLSGGLAHQLRNSIAGAKLAIQLHQRGCPENDPMIQTALTQLSLTEEQVLAVISLRADADRSGQLQDTDVATMVRDVAGLLQPYCSHWKSQLLINVPVKLICQLRSPRSVKGALLNLIQNAVEAAGQGGTVTVTAARAKTELLIEICDSGSGFAESVSELTEAFRTTKPDGVGLGLTIAEHAVDQEDGQLTIDRRNQQTCVQIQIPTQHHHSQPASREQVAGKTSR